ncbi:hypothetical protein AB0O34_14495 [Sphaerisporangium sp. NPDC088356]|uniref:hypothetical protein n=1 Tax=Sphaerisporangium sp. NPDC088356 TaxID=3154871 RepID=UPI00343C34DD
MERSEFINAKTVEEQAKALGDVAAQLRARGFTTRLVNHYHLSMRGGRHTYINRGRPELDVYAGRHHVGTVEVDQPRSRTQPPASPQGVHRLTVSEVGSPLAVADVLLSLLEEMSR